jgi:signal transduction histidine kinase
MSVDKFHQAFDQLDQALSQQQTGSAVSALRIVMLAGWHRLHDQGTQLQAGVCGDDGRSFYNTMQHALTEFRRDVVVEEAGPSLDDPSAIMSFYHAHWGQEDTTFGNTLAGIVHEMRNPLLVIRGCLDLLEQQGLLTLEVQGIAASMQADVEVLAGLWDRIRIGLSTAERVCR